MPEGGWPLAILRMLADLSLLSMLGALVFRALIGEAGQGAARWSAAVAFVALPAWAAWEAAGLGGSVLALPDVLTLTQFGHLVAAGWVCSAAVLALGGRGWRLGLTLSAAITAVVLQAGHSHAAAMDPGMTVARVCVTLHLLAAGAWLGGLLPLGWTVARAPLPDVVAAVRRYSALGIGCVLVLAVTAAWQAAILVGGLAGWVGTQYGRLALVKGVLFLGLVGFAGLNRIWLGPALAGGQATRARRRLAASIAAETVAGLAVVGVAALLSSVEPAMHQQPVWPFAYQPSLVSLNEDADIRREVVLAAVATGAALAVLAAALVMRRRRIVAVCVAAGVAMLAVPHLAVLFVPAYPASFYRSPTGFAAASIVQGRDLFAPNCAGCHGVGGQGNGPLASQTPVPPADLTAGHLWMHSDGEMFWWLSHGIEGVDGGLAMPGFSPGLADDALWALIDYVRAHNAGLVQHAEGEWSPPLLAPDLVATCPGGRQLTLASLRGQAVRILFPGPNRAPARPVAGSVTLTAGPASDGCSALDPAVPAAYALVLGVAEADLPGTSVLIDANGWLRASRPGGLDPQTMADLVRRIRSNPLSATAGVHVHAE